MSGSQNGTRMILLALAGVALALGGLAALEVLNQTDLPRSEIQLALTRSLLGLLFLAFPFWAWLSSPVGPARLLAIFGLSFGFLLMGAPSFEAPAVRSVLDGVGILALFTGLAALVHFLLAFPNRRGFLDRRWAPTLLYGPVAFVVIVSVAMLNLPLATNVRGVLGTLSALFGGVYLLTAVLLLIWRYGAASRGERAEHGLGIMLLGVLVAAAPVLLYPVVVGLWPEGIRYYQIIYSSYSPPLTLALIPITFSLAVMWSAGSRAKA